MKLITSSRSTLALALAALGLALGAPALAQSGTAAPAPKAPPSQAAKPTPPAPTLNLSTEQRQKFDALRSKTQEQLSPLRSALGTKQQELRTLWAAETPNRAAILGKVAEIDALRQQMHQLGVDRELGFRALLTPEQRAVRRTAPSGIGPHGPGMGGGMGAAKGGHMDHGQGQGSGMGMSGMGMSGMGMSGMGMSGMGMDCTESDACDECGDCGAVGACANPPAPPAKPTEKIQPRR